MPHADRWSRDDDWRPPAFSRDGGDAGRQPSLRDRARRRRERGQKAWRRRRRRAETPRRSRLFLEALIMRFLVTRPEPDNERTAAELRTRSHEVMLAPLLHIEAVANADLGAPPWAALLLTSANGARAVERHPRRFEL